MEPVQIATVFFTLDRLVAEVVFFYVGDVDLQSQASSAAKALNQRMKDVLTGAVSEFPAPLPPDVNCNGSVNSIDAALILQLEAALVSSLRCGALADADQNDRINAVDAALILQFEARLIHQLPA